MSIGKDESRANIRLKFGELPCERYLERYIKCKCLELFRSLEDVKYVHLFVLNIVL